MKKTLLCFFLFCCSVTAALACGGSQCSGCQKAVARGNPLCYHCDPSNAGTCKCTLVSCTFETNCGNCDNYKTPNCDAGPLQCGCPKCPPDICGCPPGQHCTGPTAETLKNNPANSKLSLQSQYYRKEPWLFDVSVQARMLDLSPMLALVVEGYRFKAKDLTCLRAHGHVFLPGRPDNIGRVDMIPQEHGVVLMVYNPETNEEHTLSITGNHWTLFLERNGQGNELIEAADMPDPVIPDALPEPSAPK